MLLINFVILFAIADLGETEEAEDTTPSSAESDEILSDQKKYPFIAALRKDNEFVCAAAIVETSVALTSADCAKNLINEDGEILTLTAGILKLNLGSEEVESDDLQKVGIKEVVTHPDFGKDEPRDNDIAKVILESNLTINEHVNIIKLGEEEYTEEVVDIVGWGLSDFRDVTEFVIGVALVQSEEDCKASNEPVKITETMGCIDSVVHPDICHDSGSPVIIYGKSPEDHILVGISSSTDEDKCVTKKASIFAKVSALREWILESNEEEEEESAE